MTRRCTAAAITANGCVGWDLGDEELLGGVVAVPVRVARRGAPGAMPRAHLHRREAGTMSRWWEAAVCRSVDPELFYPPPGSDGRRAKDLCGRCPVSRECLRDGARTEGRQWLFGIRAGLNPDQRRTAYRMMRDGVLRL